MIYLVKQTLSSVLLFLRLLFKEGLGNPFKPYIKKQNKVAVILANGPSLRIFLDNLQESTKLYDKPDYFVVNDFVNDSSFLKLKPRHYVLSDPLFFWDTIYKERGHKVMNGLAEKVDWQMFLYIPCIYLKSDYLIPVRQNKNITIIGFHSIHYAGLECLRHYYYKKGWGNGEFGSVVLNAIYAALILGYKDIQLYGVDHTFFKDLFVDQNNVFCHKEEHFYSKEVELKPFLCHYFKGETRNYTVSYFLKEKASIFEGHEVMNNFARSVGARILNCTETSMIDAYERKSME